MGTHPIFESDFDCLTEWEGLARDHVAEERKEILLLLALAPLHLRARLHPHHLHQDHPDRPLIDVEEKILDDVVHRHPVEDDVDLLHPDAVAHQVFHVDHVRHRRDAVRPVEGRLQDGLHLGGADLLPLDADHLDVDPLSDAVLPHVGPHRLDLVAHAHDLQLEKDPRLLHQLNQPELMFQNLQGILLVII